VRGKGSGAPFCTEPNEAKTQRRDEQENLQIKIDFDKFKLKQRHATTMFNIAVTSEFTAASVDFILLIFFVRAGNSPEELWQICPDAPGCRCRCPFSPWRALLPPCGALYAPCSSASCVSCDLEPIRSGHSHPTRQSNGCGAKARGKGSGCIRCAVAQPLRRSQARHRDAARWRGVGLRQPDSSGVGTTGATSLQPSEHRIGRGA
jgi:hypothetical protein